MKDFSELERLAKAATPGPWRHATYLSGTQNVEFPGSIGVAVVEDIKDGDDDSVATCPDAAHAAVAHRKEDKGGKYDTQRYHNAAFIAAANPQTILALTARVKELEEALKPFADNLSHAEGRQGWPDDTPAGGMNFPVITNGHLRRARVALSGKGV